MLNTYPGLIAELSYRRGISSASAGKLDKLSDDWLRLFERFPDRFLLGSDTWVIERGEQYQQIMDSYRPWLNQLPPLVAQKIAWGNAVRLFGLKP